MDNYGAEVWRMMKHKRTVLMIIVLLLMPLSGCVGPSTGGESESPGTDTHRLIWNFLSDFTN